jgi:(1->4)-alpha-D-glucan 1-alpha-D-glucosylmutase
VDFEERRRLLGGVQRETPEASWEARETGAPKLRVVHAALQVRRRFPACFGPGSAYTPLLAGGAHEGNVVAYARGDSVVVLVQRFPSRLAAGFGNTTLELPEGRFTNELTGESVEGGRIEVRALLRRFPVALLTRGR